MYISPLPVQSISMRLLQRMSHWSLWQSALCLNTNEDYDSKNISNLFLSVMSVSAAVKETHQMSFCGIGDKNLPTCHNKGRAMCSFLSTGIISGGHYVSKYWDICD